ncbi:hypothetical protein SNEBB_000530 [Seison nebaliae]|nr:hypothetical protein SNEBB_000530 [Seison nebaliae]
MLGHIIICLYWCVYVQGIVLVDLPSEYVTAWDPSGLCDQFFHSHKGITNDGKYEMHGLLGEGSFGKIYKLERKEPPAFFAIKFSESLSNIVGDYEASQALNRAQNASEQELLHLYPPLLIVQYGLTQFITGTYGGKSVNLRQTSGCALMNIHETQELLSDAIHNDIEDHYWYNANDHFQQMLSLLEIFKRILITSFLKRTENQKSLLTLFDFSYPHFEVTTRFGVRIMEYNAEIKAFNYPQYQVLWRAALSICQRIDLCQTTLYFLYSLLRKYMFITEDISTDERFGFYAKKWLRANPAEITESDPHFWKRFPAMQYGIIRYHYGALLAPLLNTCSNTTVYYKDSSYDPSLICRTFYERQKGVTPDGRFRILGRLGSGIEGATYKLLDTNNDREYALKVAQGLGGLVADVQATRAINYLIPTERNIRYKLYGPRQVMRYGEPTFKGKQFNDTTVPVMTQRGCSFMHLHPSPETVFKALKKTEVKHTWKCWNNKPVDTHWHRSGNHIANWLAILSMMQVLHFTKSGYSWSFAEDNPEKMLQAGTFTLSHCDIHMENMLYNRQDDTHNFFTLYDFGQPFWIASTVNQVEMLRYNMQMDAFDRKNDDQTYRVKKQALLNYCQHTDLCQIGLHLLYSLLLDHRLIESNSNFNKEGLAGNMKIALMEIRMAPFYDGYWKHFPGMQYKIIRDSYGFLLRPLLNACNPSFAPYKDIYGEIAKYTNDFE